MVYLVSYQKNIVGFWSSCDVFAIGKSNEDAILFAKAMLNADDTNYRNFEAARVTAYDNYEDQTYKLYKVTYKDWNCSFSDLIEKSQLSIGRCGNEAILYTKAYARTDARDFQAMQIKEVHGHTISVN